MFVRDAPQTQTPQWQATRKQTALVTPDRPDQTAKYAANVWLEPTKTRAAALHAQNARRERIPPFWAPLQLRRAKHALQTLILPQEAMSKTTALATLDRPDPMGQRARSVLPANTKSPAEMLSAPVALPESTPRW